MLQPITLRCISRYELGLLTVEEVGNLFDKGLISTAQPKEIYLSRISNGNQNNVRIRHYNGSIDVPMRSYLILQYDTAGHVTGVLSFSSMEDVKTFFDVPESSVPAEVPAEPQQTTEPEIEIPL